MNRLLILLFISLQALAQDLGPQGPQGPEGSSVPQGQMGFDPDNQQGPSEGGPQGDFPGSSPSGSAPDFTTEKSVANRCPFAINYHKFISEDIYGEMYSIKQQINNVKTSDPSCVNVADQLESVVTGLIKDKAEAPQGGPGAGGPEQGGPQGVSNKARCIANPDSCLSELRTVLDAVKGGKCKDAFTIVNAVTKVASGIGNKVGSPFLSLSATGVQLITDVFKFFKENKNKFNKFHKTNVKVLEEHLDGMMACSAKETFDRVICSDFPGSIAGWGGSFDDDILSDYKDDAPKEKILSYTNCVHSTFLEKAITVGQTNTKEVNQLQAKAEKECEEKLNLPNFKLEMGKWKRYDSQTKISIKNNQLPTLMSAAKDFHKVNLYQHAKLFQKYEKELKSPSLEQLRVRVLENVELASYKNLIQHCYLGQLSNSYDKNKAVLLMDNSNDKYFQICKNLNACVKSVNDKQGTDFLSLDAFKGNFGISKASYCHVSNNQYLFNKIHSDMDKLANYLKASAFLGKSCSPPPVQKSSFGKGFSEGSGGKASDQ